MRKTEARIQKTESLRRRARQAAECLATMSGLRQGIADLKAGRTRSMRKVHAVLRKRRDVTDLMHHPSASEHR